MRKDILTNHAEDILDDLIAADPDIYFDDVEMFGHWTTIIYKSISHVVSDPLDTEYVYNYLAGRLTRDEECA